MIKLIVSDSPFNTQYAKLHLPNKSPAFASTAYGKIKAIKNVQNIKN